jgi:ketosteroid isomerase-like protein
MQPESTLATEAAARETVNDYFSAIYAGDTQRLAHVFSPSAMLVGWDEGELKCVSRDRWFAFVETMPSPRSQGAHLDSEILQVDVFGTAAMAKVREVYRGFEYVEFLSLLWTGKHWQIVSKCYHQAKPEVLSATRAREAR